MTTRPRLETNSRQVVGLLALALFGVLSAVFLTADFSNTFADPGFGGQPITPSLGYALFNLDAGAVPSEGFLVAFEIIDLVLVAALVAAVMLGRREGQAPGSVELGEQAGGEYPMRTDGSGADEETVPAIEEVNGTNGDGSGANGDGSSANEEGDR